MRSESNQTISSSRRQERGQAHLPNLRGSLCGAVDPRLENLSIKNCNHYFSQLMVGKVGLPPLLSPARQAD